MTKQENSAMLDRLYTFMEGRTMTIDGVEGEIVYSVYAAKYPYPHTVTRLYHRPNANGKATESYQALKRLLRDDYDTDVLNSDNAYEAMCTEAERLGFWQMEALHQEVG